jgi:hypothetical protein
MSRTHRNEQCAMIENTIYVVRLAPIARTFFFTTLAGLVILEKEL